MDVNYNELFGVEEQTQAEETTDTTTAETAEQTQPEKAEEKPAEPTEEQTREERSRQAMARRIREAEERAAKTERDRVSELLSRLALDDPDTGERVDTLDKLEAYDRKQSNKRVQAGTPNEADIRRIAREEREKATQPPAPQKLDPKVQAELDVIAEMDPALKDLNAILASDIGQAFAAKVRNEGKSFIKAYTEARREQQTKAGAEASAKAKAASKDHLSKTQSLGTEEIPVPKDELALFRTFMPNASDAEIRKYYNADRKRYGPK